MHQREQIHPKIDNIFIRFIANMWTHFLVSQVPTTHTAGIWDLFYHQEELNVDEWIFVNGNNGLLIKCKSIALAV